MTQQEYQKRYEAIEREAEAGRLSWKGAMARVALLSIEYGQAVGSCAGPAAAAPMRVLRKSEAE